MYRRQDAFYARAKAVGYRSRAAFKLLELVRRYRLFRRGDRVVDLGAWPGSWLQVAAQHVGPTGMVIGVDLQPIDPLPAKTVIVISADVASPLTQQRVAEMCAGSADVLLSDLAPKLSGVRARDEARARELSDIVLRWVAGILKPGGTLVVKLFMSEDLPSYVARLRALFREVHTIRPEATRKASAEIYLVARGFRAEAGAP